MVLRFTSEHALKRSIKEDYANNTQEQRDAIFAQHKQYIGIDTPAKVEALLDKQWEEYKKNEKLTDG